MNDEFADPEAVLDEEDALLMGDDLLDEIGDDLQIDEEDSEVD